MLKHGIALSDFVHVIHGGDVPVRNGGLINVKILNCHIEQVRLKYKGQSPCPGLNLLLDQKALSTQSGSV